MANIFSKYKDFILQEVEDGDSKDRLEFPLKKTGETLNNYTRGDLIIVGGRKTSGKSSFILNNYVISPIRQKLDSKKNKKDIGVKIIYVNTKRQQKHLIDKMIVNYTSYTKNGLKLGVPNLYGSNKKGLRVSRAMASRMISSAMRVFEAFFDKGYLNVSTGRRSLDELVYFIKSCMIELGEIDELGNFVYFKEFENMVPIIALDDVTGIYSDNNLHSLRNDSAHAVAIKLKELSVLYNAVIVAGVPSYNPYNRNTSGHISNIEEIYPYNIYADRSIILHNPLETNEKQMMGYEIPSFINNESGINYIRTAYVASNYMGPSGISYSYFLYPENGFMKELPASEYEDDLKPFIQLVTGKKRKKKVVKDDEPDGDTAEADATPKSDAVQDLESRIDNKYV